MLVPRQSCCRIESAPAAKFLPTPKVTVWNGSTLWNDAFCPLMCSNVRVNIASEVQGTWVSKVLTYEALGFLVYGELP